ncbi:GntR family transcriptional regulator [Gulosibacter molinativorax]|uniref:GntR family transcriptional regulator n=1 Tax=Gulosibacter molinativorax TaxID=256821 RepID=A0ABT7C9W4_9MICO|nr:GntR family transcriptional regulator [Gulosibacter molinativorax]MDJ1371942.1 GntR family transcriptional regulator [Gulosibacter molinativorax]QUY62694.1 GntR family transcriptional regulator [Gulosibacter molinativorax]
MVSNEAASTKSKSEQAYDILKARIADGTFVPGFRIVIDQVSREYGISSGPWRESLRRLEAEGWVEITPNVGATVKRFDGDAWKGTLRVLSRLEGLATALSAPNLTADDLAEARELNARMRTALESFDTATFGQLNREFHGVLYEKSEDEHLNTLLDAEWMRMQVIRRSAFWAAPGRAFATLEEHEAIVALIEGGGAFDEVETLARQHEINTLVAVETQDLEDQVAKFTDSQTK